MCKFYLTALFIHKNRIIVIGRLGVWMGWTNLKGKAIKAGTPSFMLSTSFLDRGAEKSKTFLDRRPKGRALVRGRLTRPVSLPVTRSSSSALLLCSLSLKNEEQHACSALAVAAWDCGESRRRPAESMVWGSSLAARAEKGGGGRRPEQEPVRGQRARADEGVLCKISIPGRGLFAYIHGVKYKYLDPIINRDPI